MRKKTLIAAGIVLLCVAVAAGYYRVNRPHEGTENSSPGVILSAAELYNTYEQNEMAANGKFLGKVIQISGRVSEVSHAGSAGTLLVGNSGSAGINCSFGPGFGDQLENIHPGDSVSCKGRCTGFLMDVNLADCVLTHQEKK